MPEIVIRTMTVNDLTAAHLLSAEQGWSHRSQDWALLFASGEGVVAEVDGEVVGTTLYWNYGPEFASIGLVIVRNAMQGMGIGRRLMEAALKRVGDRRVMLNSTTAGRPMYEKLGFTPVGTLYQHQGASHQTIALRDGIDVVTLGPWADLVEFDRISSGMDRKHLLDALMPQATCLTLSEDGRLAGYALVREFGAGQVIGPVVAKDAGGARSLIINSLALNAGRFCRIDVTDEHELSVWLTGIGLPCVSEETRMCLGHPPTREEGHRYALASQATG